MRLPLLIAFVCAACTAFAQELPKASAWTIWSRDAGAAVASPDPSVRRGADPVTRIEHKGPKDWSWNPPLSVKVEPGDVLELQVDVKVEGEGDAGPCFITRGAGGKEIEWISGFKRITAGDWQTATSRFIAASNVATVHPRIIGNGKSSVLIANLKLTRKGNVMTGRTRLTTPLTIENAAMSLKFDPRKAAFTYVDKRSGDVHEQFSSEALVIVTDAKVEEGVIRADLLELQDDLKIRLEARLDGGKAEAVITLAAEADMSRSIRFPGAIQARPGQSVVFPMNEGISFPVEDDAMPRWPQVAYGGHGICMPFFGAVDNATAKGWMVILQTPDDASVQLGRTDGLNWAGPGWDPQRGEFGYQRSIRYVLLDAGGHVAMAKRYRQYASETGLLKTFTEKVKQRPQVDKLLGAVNVWCWDANAAPIAKEMLDAGIDRILWSNKLKPDQLQKLNEMGILTSRYDIYQDLMDPASFPKLRYTHPDWTTAGFPKDIILNRQGKPIPGWEIEAKDGSGMIPCAVLCDLRAPEYAIARIGEELKTHAYQCRFIDTTTASPWRECYHPDHPMTRTQSREAKMKLLAVVSDRYKLVCGSETGHDAAVPYCDYFEGMLSLGPYRVPDSGRAMQKIYNEVPEKLSKFQVGEKYRLPLWELVYHDACVAQWYWGDYNNKLPGIWKKRDLFNALYAAPPMFMFSTKMWQEQKARFVESYKASAAITRATAYSEMTDHRFLTADRSVQQTSFANGAKVTVNFGAQTYRDGAMEVAPESVVFSR